MVEYLQLNLSFILAMSKIKLCGIKFKLKAIECTKKTQEMANNIILFSCKNSVLIVLCSHFFSNKWCPNSLVRVVFSNDACYWQPFFYYPFTVPKNRSWAQIKALLK